MVAVEVPSLTFRPADTSADNLLSVLVFGDGAGAAVLRSGAAPAASGSAGQRHQLVAVEHRRARLRTRRRRLPGRGVAPAAAAPRDPPPRPGQRLHRCTQATSMSIALHPGGQAIVDSVVRCLGLRRTSRRGNAAGHAQHRQHLVSGDPLRARGARRPPPGAERSRPCRSVRTRTDGRAHRVALGVMTRRARTALVLANGAQRLVELRISARNRAAMGRAEQASPSTYPRDGRRARGALCGQRLAPTRTARPATGGDRRARRPRGVRPACVSGSSARSGPSWNVTAHVPPDMHVETGGPYRYVRHPNYVAVALEFACLPLAVGCRSGGRAALARQCRGARPADSRRGAPARRDPRVSRGVPRRPSIHSATRAAGAVRSRPAPASPAA